MHTGRGWALQEIGRSEEAEQAFRRAIELDPADANAAFSLGNMLRARGQPKEAEEHFLRARDVLPDDSRIHNNLGIVLWETGRLQEAEASYLRALELNPEYANAHSNLGSVLLDQGKPSDAEASCRRALEIQPEFASAHYNLGNALRDQGRLDEAEASYRAALDLKPDFTSAHHNLGDALRDSDRAEEAVASYRRALQLVPGSAGTNIDLGTALQAQGKLDEAEASYRRALQIEPNHGLGHYNLALLLLLRGELAEGWAEHEWRWRTRQMRRFERRFPQPQWDGRDLAGGTILLHAEQGMGDAIQFVRYASFVASKAGRVILECKPVLADLLRSVDGIDEVVASGSDLPSFDVHCPLLSLPRLHGTTLETIPALPQYIAPNPAKVSAWAKRLDGPDLKVGLVWAGNPKHLNDRNRSLDAKYLQGFAEMGSSFFSLQVGARSADLETLSVPSAITDLAPHLTDYGETAAAIANLDLVICVDTSVAHLAGALGKPVWVLLPYVPDWRWLLEREDSLWYASARLYRQDVSRDWQPVLDRIRTDLRSLSAGDRPERAKF